MTTGRARWDFLLHVYGADAFLAIDPSIVLLDDGGYTTWDTTLNYTILPPQYRAARADIDLFKTDQTNQDSWIDYLPGDSVQGQGKAVYVKGSGFDINSLYKVQVVLNRGTDIEIRGRNEIANDTAGNNNGICEQGEQCVDKVPIPLGQMKLWNVPDDPNEQPVEVKGAVTDDVTKLKLELTVKQGIEALPALTWAIVDPQMPDATADLRGTLLDGNTPVNSLQVAFDSNGVATAKYKVPPTFVRFGTSLESYDKELAERELLIRLNDDTRGLPPIKLRRPPVVLVHGLWGCGNRNGCGNNNAYAWKDFEPKLNDKQQYDITPVDYYVPGMVRSIADMVVETKFSKALDKAVESSNAKGFASSKVDVIGHSMGGLVTRQYCSDNSSDCQNRIRRVITIATPHFGSELADLLLVYRGQRQFFPNNTSTSWYGLIPLIMKCQARVDMLVQGKYGITPHPIGPVGGAIDDLATGHLPDFLSSNCTTTQGRWSLIPALSGQLRAHTITSRAPEPQNGYDSDIAQLWKHVLLPCGFTRDNLYGNGIDNDRIVPEISQQEYLSGSQTTMFDGTDHLSVRNSDQTIGEIKLKLDEPIGSGSFTKE